MKQLYLILYMLVISTAFSATALAADLPKKFVSSEINTIVKRKSPELTDAQKAEMKSKYEASKAKWGTLNKNQKEEIYKLNDKALDVKVQIIDKYLEFGVIDKETSERIKSKITDLRSEIRKSDKMPALRYKGKR